MLALIRIILIIFFSIIICIVGIVMCLLKPDYFCYSAIFGRFFGYMVPILGLKIIIKNQSNLSLSKNCVYVANHQSNYDVIVVASVVPSRTITIGKKSLLWVPFFGQLFWLSGNILINRNQCSQSYRYFSKIVRSIKENNVSIWIFPEGTRNGGKKLLPFKIGAFYISVMSNLSIVPVCISNYRIKLNRWFNGLVIIEVMPSITIQNYRLNQVRNMTQFCHDLMQDKIDELNQEILLKK